MSETACRVVRIRTDYRPGQSHPDVLVVLVDGEPELRFCGDSWCTGECGLPAAVLADIGDGRGERKMYSSMTACGPVMQSWRVKWTGERYVMPEKFREHLLKAYWL